MDDHQANEARSGGGQHRRRGRWADGKRTRGEAWRARRSPSRAEPPHEPNWIAAYAMGLASAQRRVEVCLQELIRAAGSERRRLHEARERLRALREFDPALCAQAERLLTASIEQLDGDSRGSRGGEGTCPEVLDPPGDGALEPPEIGPDDPAGETGTTMTRPGGGA